MRTGDAVPALACVDGQFDDELDGEEEVWLYVDGVGARESWRDMDRFIDDEVPAVMAAPFRDAIEGKGAFSRFRAQLDTRSELLDSWRLYSEERRLGRARQWLADESYRPGRTSELRYVLACIDRPGAKSNASTRADPVAFSCAVCALPRHGG